MSANREHDCFEVIQRIETAGVLRNSAGEGARAPNNNLCRGSQVDITLSPEALENYFAKTLF